VKAFLAADRRGRLVVTRRCSRRGSTTLPTNWGAPRWESSTDGRSRVDILEAVGVTVTEGVDLVEAL
jgi:hypothetical protein